MIWLISASFSFGTVAHQRVARRIGICHLEIVETPLCALLLDPRPRAPHHKDAADQHKACAGDDRDDDRRVGASPLRALGVTRVVVRKVGPVAKTSDPRAITRVVLDTHAAILDPCTPVSDRHALVLCRDDETGARRPLVKEETGTRGHRQPR